MQTQEEIRSFELNMVIRDKDGKPLSRKVIKSDSASDIDNFWQNNRLLKRHKKNRHRDQGVLQDGQAKKLMTEIFGENTDGEESDSVA
jgi:hypothetical protein